ncbi:uncharacterized protein MELLADRAFT_59171 [Melampsora larici-populina 98AG31]|uniref:Uncharacterized protein n=1 Tax=Melampsora larici-populina (strain 98AG31 / pathotype 3-4-7) TaxID=747676 RepID=F4R5A8_MELLP|nr:uncharacterized protein MELLADRAFT_59171 [Melampsora larici-populina 98AG31]EGG12015.1 hypothetical protein MELLADRAFT_59171 [Melampsora larici-populina 98AG31]
MSIKNETTPMTSVNTTQQSTAIITVNDAIADFEANVRPGLLEPSNHHLTGDDAPACHPQHDPLHRVGTTQREQFNRNNEATVVVLFKIYTNDEAPVDMPAPKPTKRTASSKANSRGSGSKATSPAIQPPPSPQEKRTTPLDDDEEDTPLAFYNRKLKKVKVEKFETDPNFWVPDPSEEDAVLSSELEILEKHEYELDKFLINCGLSSGAIPKSQEWNEEALGSQ